jgi:hypothetical protein
MAAIRLPTLLPPSNTSPTRPINPDQTPHPTRVTPDLLPRHDMRMGIHVGLMTGQSHFCLTAESPHSTGPP